MRSISILCVLGTLALGSAAVAGAKKDDKIPVTAKSDEARQAYLKGRDLNEKLRATDARLAYQEAWSKDNTLALAALGLAQTSTTAKEFWDSLGSAQALAGKVSEGERLQIQAAEAGAKNNPAAQKAILTKLTKAYPNDERAHMALGAYHFGQQEYPEAIAEYNKAVAINPSFSPPYNQLGYAQRFVEKYDDAEKSFRKYIELIPGDPNPYDSLAELLMKMGRYDESIKQYEKALSIEKTFIASYIGIGNDYMFMDKGNDARATFAKLDAAARTVGEKRTANFWMSQSYLFEGETDKALAEMKKNMAIGDEAKDLPMQAGDHAVIGEILLAAGRADEALANFTAQRDKLDKADVPPEVKEQAHRGFEYDAARCVLAKGDLAGAKTHLAELTKLNNAKKLRFNVFAQHEVAGMIALAEKRYPAAVTELSQANTTFDPRIHYLLGLAHEGAGNAAKAKEAFTKAADFNGFANNYPFVRKLAKAKLSS